MNKIPVSVFIITKNEEDRIAKAVNAVKEFASEILVIDSCSSDRTVEIAKNLGAEVVFNNWPGYGQQKIFGENLCKNDWILNIDADEEVSADLAREIKQLFLENRQDQFVGYRVKIINKFFNEDKPKKLAYYYNQLRLYNKKHCGFKDSTVHDSVIVKNQPQNENNIGQLRNGIAHQSFRSYEHWLDKINSYSSDQANDYLQKSNSQISNPISVFKVASAPLLNFLKAYFIRRYFIYGFDGLIYSYLYAFSRTIRLIKIREISKK